MKFTEAQLDDQLGEEGYPHDTGNTLTRSTSEVLIKEDLRQYLEKIIKTPKKHL